MRSLLFAAVLIAGCSDRASDPMDPQDPATEDPEQMSEDPAAEEPPSDDFDPSQDPPPVEDNWVPRPFTATRFGVFYQVTGDVLDAYQDLQSGMPKVAGHAWLITQSHATAYASKTLGDRIHLRSDFYYAPAFDLWDAKHMGWQTATDAQLMAWAHDFRDTALKAHADLFTFNESPSTTGSSANVREKIAKILRYIHQPDAKGRVLWGVVYMTEKSATVSSWTEPGTDFFKAISETAIAFVAEHYHSTSYVCTLTEGALASHYFAFRKWLLDSGEPAKAKVAAMYTVLHSSRYNAGTSGWAGGNSDVTSLATYQRALSRIARVTRMTEGGVNRISFAPTASNITLFGVQPRITGLMRWHYLHTAAQASETACIDNFGGNCTCN